MDMDDDDAFLYGDQPSPPVKAEVKKEDDAPQEDATADDAGDASKGLSASMAASLAAYGIDPTTAVADQPLEDGGVEEEDEDDDSDDSDDDDIKLVMTGGPQRTLDLRRPQPAQTSNVIGIGKWAHTATANAPPVVSPTAQKVAPRSTAAADSLTDYTPPARPGTQSATATTAPAAHSSASAVAQTQLAPGNGPPPTTALPHSTLAVQAAPSTDPKIDGTHPTGIIPSTGTSVYDVDVAQFEGSGQMWRRPGSDISDWFNYGFDEVTYPKFLRYKQEMEAGRMGLANMTQMNPLTPDVASMLHLPTGNVNNPQMQQMQMQQQMQQMQQQMMMGGMDPAAIFAMQNQGMPGMGMMAGMMQQGNESQGGDQDEGGAPAENGANTETPTPQMQMQNAFPGRAQNAPARGAMAMGRGMNMPLRGRGGAPLGPRGVALAGMVPKGPKVGRFKDKDRVHENVAAAASTSLDYGDTAASNPGSRDQSPSRYAERERYGDREDRYADREERDRHGDREERDRYGDREDRYGERERESRSSRRTHDDVKDEGEFDEGRRERERERESDRYGEREERDRYGERETRRSSSRRNDAAGTVSASTSTSAAGGLGPDGWESGEEGDDRRRRKRSRSAEEEGPRRSTRAKRR